MYKAPVSQAITIVFALFLMTGPAILNAEEQTGWTSSGKVLTLQDMSIDKIRKEIRLSVKLALNKGILEYFLVGDHGKTYESVFKIRGNRPSDLNFALLLIGCEPLPSDIFSSLTKADLSREQLIKKYAQYFLEVELWRDGKKIDIYDLIKDREKKRNPMMWVYTGGLFTQQNRYSGDYELSFMGIWSDPTAVINLVSPHGNPYKGDFGFEMAIKEEKYRIDQDFTLVIRRYGK